MEDAVGRSRSFDTAEVVRRARAVFWRTGYEAASLPEIEAATGLQRSSIYHAFGNKRGLFDAAVDSYLDEVVRPRLAPLTAGTVSPRALAGYIEDMIRVVRRPESPLAGSGCLLIGAASSPIGRDEGVRTIIAAYRAELRGAFRAGVDARFPDLADRERARLAETCTALVVAALATVRADRASAEETLRTALGLVE
jgi:AcrR family transcriptional regulator